MPKKKNRKHKKRPTSKQRLEQKILKIRDFKSRMENFSEAGGFLDEFRNIDDSHIEFLYKTSHRQFIINFENGCNINKKVKSYLFNGINFLPTLISFKFYPTGPDVYLSDFLYGGMTLLNYFQIKKKEGLKFSDEAERAIDLLTINKNASYGPLITLGKIFEFLSWHINLVHKGYYWFTFGLVQKDKKRKIDHFCLNLFFESSEVRSIRIDGSKRNVYRIGRTMYDEGIYWAKIHPSLISQKFCKKSGEFNVYIQEHAIQRLYERLDSFISREYLHFELYQAVINPEISTCDGKTLLEYKLIGWKVGYLLIDIHENIVLIRTFLFITNDGTPEGTTLRKKTGLESPDKQYWAIDKLSTFVNREFRKNNTLKTIFEECGCGHLYKIDPGEFDNFKDKLHPEELVNSINLRVTGK
jgi:hypothetical protein